MNQGELLAQVKKVLELKSSISKNTNTDFGHGRIENRKCTVSDDLRFFDVTHQWQGIKTVIKIESERIIKLDGKIQKEERFYISSLAADCEFINNAVRNHWSIEITYIGCQTLIFMKIIHAGDSEIQRLISI